MHGAGQARGLSGVAVDRRRSAMSSVLSSSAVHSSHITLVALRSSVRHVFVREELWFQTSPFFLEKWFRQTNTFPNLTTSKAKRRFSPRTGSSPASTMPVVMTGSKPRAPVAFGEYEIGRSKKPVNRKPTAAFKDGMKKGLELEQQGDPGAYDPYMNSDIVATSSFTHNKTQKPFQATSTRDLAMQLYGEDSPGPGAYQAAESAKKQYAAVDPNISVFRSGSLQRPKDDTPVPGAGTYSPNMASVYANKRDSGASLRSAGGRFRVEQSMTEPGVGPGSYEETSGTLLLDSQQAVLRSSKIKPAFSTTSPQRSLPFLPQDTPGPGSYEPLEPRLGKAKRS
jgi:hypothetical protein